MKILAFLMILLLPGINWSGDFTVAKTEAAKSHKVILINFSGSDWCGPCIRLRKEILESGTFESYAADHLLLVRADFPRQKKNQLASDQVKRNESLADKYNPEGKFPFTLLVDEHGKILKFWDGYPDVSPQKFVQEISALTESK